MTIALICLAALTICGITWRMRKPRGQPAKSRFSAADRSAVSTSSNRLYAVVDRDEALVEPYPYIHVEKDGTARELHASEREYLETPFQFGDGGRPYVKSSYEEKNGWGEISGFLKRAEVPVQIQIHPSPVEDPSKCPTREDQIRLIRERGFEVTEIADGLFTARKATKIKDN